jgi:hypothetical protein
MAYDSIKSFIYRKLGYPRVKVYLTSEQIDDCVWESVNRFYEYRDGPIMEYSMAGSPGKSKYLLPPQIVPQFIHTVTFKPTDPMLTVTGVADDIYLLYYLRQGRGAQSFIVDYWMTLVNYKEYQRVLGTEPHWQLAEGNKIQLDPVPSIAFAIKIRYQVIPSEAEIENTRWIRLYTLALAKQTEGEIRSKFSTFTAGSGEVGLNGDALKGESVAEKQILEQELFEKQPPLYMIVG